ncbi:hypothetical protein SDC9_102426 [bioreactor metagenome]|uniref:Uncharacterized protein n=1 Tax=bioreactor metagenome TaxID=1076179 RepID=A0A645ARD2_9ZZZZ
MPICTPLAPSFKVSTISRPDITPPAAITGILTALLISGINDAIAWSVPRCPPASLPSTTTADAPRDSEIFASLTDDTIGTIGVPEALPIPNISREKPAPATIRSMPSSIAVSTSPANTLAATIAFIPIIPLPFVSARARRISYRSSSKVIPDAAIKPIPPSLATAAAKRAVESLIAMPPCIIGTLATRWPIFSSGSFKY